MESPFYPAEVDSFIVSEKYPPESPSGFSGSVLLCSSFDVSHKLVARGEPLPVLRKNQPGEDAWVFEKDY